MRGRTTQQTMGYGLDWPNLMQSNLGLILFVAMRRKFSHVVPSMNNCICGRQAMPLLAGTCVELEQ